jgi:hypothetical protein
MRLLLCWPYHARLGLSKATTYQTVRITEATSVLLLVPVDPKCFLPCSWNEKYQFGLDACFKMLMFSPNLMTPLDVASFLFMGVASMRVQFGKATLDSPLARYLGW